MLNSVRKSAKSTWGEMRPAVSKLEQGGCDCSDKGARACTQGIIAVPVQADARVGSVRGVLADRHLVRNVRCSRALNASVSGSRVRLLVDRCAKRAMCT